MVSLARHKDPYLTFGRVVSYLMSDPVFSRMPFGHITKLLAGQINRAHYLLACDETKKVVGFVGWSLAPLEIAEKWIRSEQIPGNHDPRNGPACIINFWKVDSADINRVLVPAMRREVAAQTHVYAKRFYPDGRVRPLRLQLKTDGAPADETLATGSSLSAKVSSGGDPD